MGLAVSEKSHWKDRIACGIEQRIETLVAKGDPVLLRRAAEQARARACESLGIGAQQDELGKLQEQKLEREKRVRWLMVEQRSIINGTSIEVELGRQVVALRTERENLLDTVWLAISPSQIKELWGQVNALLELKPTALEERALQTAPLETAPSR